MLNPKGMRAQGAWVKAAHALSAHPQLRLAVSGGADSLAMLVGLAAQRESGALTSELEVVTVDHGLRADAAREVEHVRIVCRDLGVPCYVAKLTPPSPVGNVQAWARDARYEALGEQGGFSAPLVLTAHTADDQAETFLMRAARGAASEGLSSIRPHVRIGSVAVGRPFLAWTREALRSVLNDTPWLPIDDPSNQDASFTRVRFRSWLANPPLTDGERPIVEGLAQTAELLSHDNAALEHYARSLVRDLGGAERGYVDGVIAFRDIPLSVQARMLRAILAAVRRVDGSISALDLGRMTALAKRVGEEPSGRWVGGGATFEWRAGALEKNVCLRAYAEAGRQGFPEIMLRHGENAVWDGRFQAKFAGTRSGWPVDGITALVRAWRPGDRLPAALGPLPSKALLGSLPVMLVDDEPVAWGFTLSEPGSDVPQPSSLKPLRRSVSG